MTIILSTEASSLLLLSPGTDATAAADVGDVAAVAEVVVFAAADVVHVDFVAVADTFVVLLLGY